MIINILNLNLSSNNNSIAFKAHPDFKRLAKDYEILASSYFRRGGFYGSPSDEYPDVIESVRSIFRQNNSLKKLLIGGIGKSQEPFSLLAVIKHILNQGTLKNNVDLNIIDLQSKPTRKKLFEQSYLDDIQPRYVADSFIRDEGEQYGFKSFMHYRVKDDIFEFLNNTYRNPNKAFWDSRIQDVVKELPDENFDIISVNNTLGYINEGTTILDTIKHLIRTLKKGGIFITDPHSSFNIACADKTVEIYKGIFKKY